MIKIDNDFKFKKGDVIIIGCSSGPDSMALTDMLLKIRDKYSLFLVLAHVNHNVRVESAEEEKFLQQYCIDNQLIFESMTIEKYGDDNFHNEARLIRYNFFESLVEKYKANYLMTAHHGDDLTETILMRLVRGSNLNGYSGFKEIVDKGSYKIVRPLIFYTKDELREYVVKNNIKFYDDSSNMKDKYTRNRYRKYILPFLKKEDKAVHKKFLKFSRALDDANTYIAKVRDRALTRVLKDEDIIISELKKEDHFIQREILYYLLEYYYQDDLILLNDKHIELLFKLINSRKANTFVNLPNDVVAYKEYDMLKLKRDTDIISGYEIEFDNYVELPGGHYIKKLQSSDDNSNNVCRLSSEDIALPLIVRTRRIGDKMYVKGLNGSKKVKDIFIDKKMKMDKRGSWPIVIDSKGNIVWIPGVKKSKFDKSKNDSYDILLKYY